MAVGLEERTLPQVATLPGEDLVLPRTPTGATYKQYRTMRKDPTIALARALAIAPVLASSWSIESNDLAPEGAREFIDEQMQPLRMHLLKHSMQGCIDFGWQPFEKVPGVDNQNRIVFTKLKPLLQDITEILVDKQTGAFAGLRQNTEPKVDLVLEQCLVIALDVEGTDWYGFPQLENVRASYNQWLEVEKAATRYDNKIAGGQVVVKVPEGESLHNGTATPNVDIGRALLTTMQSSGGAVIPSTKYQSLDDTAGESEWDVEFANDGGSGRAQFIERQNYLDKLKVRGLGLPERSVLEGQFGTKAEAETHGDFAITFLEVRHAIICQLLNWHLVNQLLRLNYGEQFENTVYIVPSPIADVQRQYLKSVYNQILTNAEGFREELDNVDRNALRDTLGIPSSPDANTTEIESITQILPDVTTE